MRAIIFISMFLGIIYIDEVPKIISNVRDYTTMTHIRLEKIKIKKNNKKKFNIEYENRETDKLLNEQARKYGQR